MDKRTTGIIATVVTALLCGCPGLASLCWGALSAVISFVPGAQIDMFGNQDPSSALYTGLGALCLGIVFVAIPIAVGFLTLRNRPAASPVPSSDEPIPPAI